MFLRSLAISLPVLISQPATAQRAAPVTAARAEAPVVLTAPQRAAAIADIVKVITERYVFPDRVAAIAAQLTDGLTSGRYETDSPIVFAERVTADLRSSSRDRHMYLNYAPGEFAAAAAAPAGSDAPNPALDAIWARQARRANHGLEEMRILPGNVRYLRISGFQWVEDRSGAAYDAAMRFLGEGDAIVIDLRGNGGGSHAAVRYLLSHFLPGDTLDMTFLQAGKEPVQSRTLEYLPAGRLSGRPLYVLIDNGTGSAAEAFAYDVRQFRLGTLVGATTAGAANNNGFYPIAPGFMLSYSFGTPLHPVSKSNWEAVGVAPDVVSDADRALDVAQSLALTALLDRAGADAGDVADWNWARIAVAARLSPPRLPAATLRPLAGRYGVLQVVWRDGALFYVRRSGQQARLIPLTTDGLFAVEGFNDHFRIRLTGDAMETQWNDEPMPTRVSRTGS